MALTTTTGPEAVADALWDRVRRLARVTEGLAEAEALGVLDEEGQARLARARLRLERAAARAMLADDLSDQLANLRAQRARGSAYP
jgi:hypothetical protein